jgi:electron transport complex protein RnfC
MSKALLTFRKGGVHPRDSKELTQNLPIETMPVPEEVDILLLQHAGSACKLLVGRKAQVSEGDLIGTVEKGLGANLHASIDGTVKEIGVSAHPVLVQVPSVTIAVNREAAPKEPRAPSDWKHLSPAEILGVIRNCGLVGMGGAGFPTHVKLALPAGVQVDKLILNGSECEPYLNCDNRLMIEFPDAIVEGAKIMLHILGIRECHIGVENNKREAIRWLALAAKEASTDDYKISVHSLRAKYPQGSEKQLIQSITGRKVPAYGLPFDVGAIVINVGTAKAIHDAVVLGKPLYERVVTVSGRAVARPANLMVRVGTRLRDIVAYLGGIKNNLARIVMGGPMMGFSVSTLDMPVTKVTSGILFLSEDEIDSTPHGQCIRCGWCIDACSMGLAPNEIGLYVEAGRAAETAPLGVFECVECGCCAYVCPAKRPLVQFCRLAKAKARR